MENERKNVLGLMNRREFLRVAGLGALSVAVGCAKNPVTGETQLMLMSEAQEISLDQQQSPHQFSADYGPVQDKALNSYVSRVGMGLARNTHRPDMPYSFRCLNATYVNAYAFPGGSIGATRAILLKLENEAELAALLGHELGHVNARHSASRASKGQIASLLAGLGAAAVGSVSRDAGSLAAGLGSIGTGALLASYSRDDERQADGLGTEYMFRSGYNTKGMVELMDMLNEQHQGKASAFEMMFATHPMSSERLATARKAAAGKYATSSDFKFYRERYMDNTASLRKLAPAIEEMQKGTKLMGEKKHRQAQEHYQSALKKAPNDYAGLLMLAKCQLVQKDNAGAVKSSAKAKQVYPKEPQARQVSGVAQLREGRYERALGDFTAYEKMLAGNPYTVFYKGMCQEKLGSRNKAAREYYRFLQSVNQGDEAKYAYTRLVEWGYVRQ